ncbi:type 1 glutamine amidotransferase [bacterium]|nr:MAG: type 1 glutamine amidotransferase [bacterium]
MKPVFCLRHEQPDTLGAGDASFSWSELDATYIDVWSGQEVPPLEEASALVVLGGSMGVPDIDRFPFLNTELATIRDALHHSLPVLGICLGAQLLAAAAGADVFRAPHRTLGFRSVMKLPAAASDPLFRTYCNVDRVLRWHEDTFTLPAAAELLMTSHDLPHQAFRVGACAWGVQFHIEVDDDLLHAWLDAAGPRLQAMWGTSRDALLSEADHYLTHQQRHSDAVFAAFARVVRQREGRVR